MGLPEGIEALKGPLGAIAGASLSVSCQKASG